MMAVVIDASIAAAWCFPDEQAQAAEHVLDILPQTEASFPDSSGMKSAIS